MRPHHRLDLHRLTLSILYFFGESATLSAYTSPYDELFARLQTSPTFYNKITFCEPIMFYYNRVV